MIMMMISTIPPVLIPLMNHPLSLGCLLLIQTLLIALIAGSMSMTFWYSYIMFLIMVGGMLILFMYMTNVASNEKFKFSSMITIPISSMVTILILTLPFIDLWIMNKGNWIFDKIDYSELIIKINKFLNFPGILASSGLIIYLLISMIAVIEIVKIKYGPLRHN